MTRKKTVAPPSQAQQQHAQKITHRAAGGKFKPAPHQEPPLFRRKPKPAELDQDAGAGYNPDRSDIQQ